MLRHTLTRAALEALHVARAPHWLPPAADASGFVLMLHHVRPARASSFDPNALLSVTPDFLDRLLGHLIERGWRFVPVDELVADRAVGAAARRISVTLDDGYRDNLEHAWPVFRKNAVPFTIYVCPGFADRTAELWWEALERIIAATDSLAPPGEGAAALPTRTHQEKQAMFQLWTSWLTTEAGETRQRVAIRALSASHGLDFADLAEQLVMDWREVRTIAADPLCSIGAHTMTHPALARLSSEDAFREIKDSVDQIGSEIGTRPKSLAFPYGHAAAAGPREAELAEQVGLASSFTTQLGYMPASGSRHGLPRVPISGLFQRVRYMDVLLSSGFWTIRHRLRALR